jgi:dsRNA-specific ribonuclease
MTTARKKQKTKREPVEGTPEVRADWRELEDKLGHRFERLELLTLALTHRSHTYEARHGVPAVILPAHPEQRDQRNAPGTDNEQLEFLGDAVLGLVVTEALFREFPQCSEGELTRLRSNLVSRKRMADMGVELGLGGAMLMGKSAEQNGGRKKPALLANASEAVLAAVYLDAGEEGLVKLRAIAERYLVQPEMEAMRAALAVGAGRGAMRDHKTLLQERVQAEGARRTDLRTTERFRWRRGWKMRRASGCWRRLRVRARRRRSSGRRSWRWRTGARWLRAWRVECGPGCEGGARWLAGDVEVDPRDYCVCDFHCDVHCAAVSNSFRVDGADAAGG